MRNPSFIDLQNIVEKLSNEQLRKAILNPEPGMPPVIPVSEAGRRHDLRQRYKQTEQGPPEQTTVAEDMLQTLSPSNTGLGRAAPQQPAVQQPAQMPSSIMPQLPPPPPPQPIMPPPQQMAAMGGPGGLGGLGQPQVYARGGRVRGYYQGGSTYGWGDPNVGLQGYPKAWNESRVDEGMTDQERRILNIRREAGEDISYGHHVGADIDDIVPSETLSEREARDLLSVNPEGLVDADASLIRAEVARSPHYDIYNPIGGAWELQAQADRRDREFVDPIPVQSNPALEAYKKASLNLEAGLEKYPLGPAAMRVPPSQAKLNLENVPEFDISGAPIPRREDVAAFPSLTDAPVVPGYKSGVDYDAERAKREKQLLEEESPYAGQLAALTETEEGIEKDSETNKWLAVAWGGFVTTGTPGTVGQAVAEGAKAGINYYTEGQKDLEARKDRAFDARTALIGVEEERKGRIKEASRHYAEGLINQQQLVNDNLRYTFDAESASFQIKVAAAERKWTQDHKAADVDYASQLQERANFLDDRKAIFENEIAKLDAEITNNTIDFANRNAVFTAREAADQRKLESQRELFKLQIAILDRSKSDMFASLTAQERQKFDLELKLIEMNAPTALVKSAQAAMKDEDLAKMLIRLGGGKASQALGKTISSTWKSTLKTYLDEAEGFGPDTNWGNLRDKYAGMLAGESSLTVEQAGFIADGVIARAQSLTGSSGGQRPDSAGTPTYQRVD